MITLTTIVLLIWIFSFYKINQVCKSKGLKFDPSDAPLKYDTLFFGTTIYIIALLIGICIKYLP